MEETRPGRRFFLFGICGICYCVVLHTVSSGTRNCILGRVVFILCKDNSEPWRITAVSSTQIWPRCLVSHLKDLFCVASFLNLFGDDVGFPH